MKLADLRKLAIKQKIEIHFPLANGMECVVGKDGVARVPALRRPPDFNLEVELESATQFLLDPPPRQVKREELAAMSEPQTATAAAHEHEEE